ncbi:MAG: oligoendopeptidase F [Planctomycetes bacterium]|nr:oligoendopeptidase F [Planctomycetota bacterium]
MKARLPRSWMTVVVLTLAVIIAGCADCPAAPQTSATPEPQRVRERSEIDTKYLWATENIFPSDEAWEAEYKAVAELVEQVSSFKGTLGQSAEQLLKVLRFRDELEPRLERVYVYTSLLSDQDTRNGDRQAMKSRAIALYIKYGQLSAWAQPELTQIPFETIEEWMADNPDLALYRQALDDLFRQKKYILSEREEELMALTGEVRRVASNTYNLLTNADIKFPEIKDAQGQMVELDDQAFYLYMRSPDRRVRKDAYEAIVGTYADYRNTAAALLNGAVQSHILTVKARGYDSCLAAALHDTNIPTQVYENLIDTVNQNLPLLHRYQELRQRVLKLDDGVHAYDLFAPFLADQEFEYPYETAVETIIEALQPLGGEYLAAMKKGFGSRWVDVYPTKGKRSGAYSSGTYLTQPYILLNYHGGFDDVSTLAHEMGHSMHSHMSRGTQPYIYSDYSIFCAEVASTCNEIILQNYILERTEDPEKKLYLLVEFLEGFRGTVFRQAMFSEFEHKIHEMAEAGQPLTADSLGAAYREIMKRYYGPQYVHDELVDNYWIRIPHFYYNFYVYKYATSYCAASNIAKRIMAGEPGAVEAYMSFLKGGSHKYPIDMLKLARVDMMSPQPIQDAMKLFEGLLDQTEALLGELGK